MARAHGKGAPKIPISLLLVEGDTDVIFYERVKAAYLSTGQCRVVIQNLEGLFNINKKVVNKLHDYCDHHRDEVVKAYCCVDRESRDGKTPGLDLGIIIRNIREKQIEAVLSIDKIVATQQIESWFFWDIDGIYKCLRTPRARRRKAYRPPERYTYRDMIRLFRDCGKVYNKGKRCRHFIEQLNFDTIVKNCRELSDGIKLIKAQGDDLTNHLFT